MRGGKYKKNIMMEIFLTKSNEMQNIQISKKGESTNDHKDVTDNVTLFIYVKLYKLQRKTGGQAPPPPPPTKSKNGSLLPTCQHCKEVWRLETSNYFPN